MQSVSPEVSIKVFIISAHVDQKLCKKLEEHLSSLIYSGEITLWQDQEIPAGEYREEHMKSHLCEADLILLLVSASFIASKYKEVQVAFQRHKAGMAQVVPLILKPVHWQSTLLGQLQVLPTGGKPVTQWSDQDAAFEDVVRGIRNVVEPLQRKLQELSQKKDI